MKKHIFRLLLQFIFVLSVSLISYLLRPLRVIFTILIYIFIPLFSACTACRIVKKGINPYLAWILPPISETIAGFIISMGIGPDPLPIMITAFISLVGSALGDVINKTLKKGKS